jgi:hypothetical protein
MLERQEEHLATFEEAREPIVRQLQQRDLRVEMRKRVDELKAEFPVEIFL